MYGSIELSFVPVKVKDLVEISVSPLRSQIKDKEIELHLDVDDNIPEVKIDIEKVAWVLVNLLGNAIRYTPRWGSITIKARKVKSFVELSVTDSGEGIEEKYLDSIFESLVKNPGNPKKVGLGLALTISREIIEAHSGIIKASSTIGEGSIFSIQLPIS